MCCTQPQFYFYFSSRKSFLEVETNERKRSVQSSSGELSVLRIDEGERESLLLLVVPQPIDVDKSSRNARKSVCRG